MNETREAMSRNFAKSLGEPEISASLMDELIYRPLYNTMTFGFYSYFYPI